MSMAAEHTNQAGAIIGASLVFGKKVLTSVYVLGQITWPVIIDASILAAVGACVGFFVTAGLKRLTQSFFKPKKPQ